MVMAVVPLSVSSMPGFWCIYYRSSYARVGCVCAWGNTLKGRERTGMHYTIPSTPERPAHHVVELEEAMRDPLPDVALRLLAPQVRPQLLHQLCWSKVVGRSAGFGGLV